MACLSLDSSSAGTVDRTSVRRESRRKSTRLPELELPGCLGTRGLSSPKLLANRSPRGLRRVATH